MKPLKLTPGAVACVAAGLLALAAESEAAAGETVFQTPPQRHDVVGTLSCSSVSCHGQREPQASAASTHRQAYHLWLAADPHAHAGLRIAQPRFQEVLRRASQRDDGGVDPAVYEKCAKCHDPIGAEQTMALTLPFSQGERGRSLGRGIGCETCHGPASAWIAKHYELGVSREELRELGMADTKDVMVRAKLCAECHVGSAENDVTHDMLAAGHPPLRFEMASHQALIERKHWDDTFRRKSQPDYELQLWAAGRIAAAEAALALLEVRARNAAAGETPIGTDKSQAVWPELAEYNCFACHQPIRSEVGKLPLASSAERAAGVPPWQQWNFECLPSPAPDFAIAFDRLRTDMERSFAPAPQNIARLATEARAALPSGSRHATASDLLDAVANRRGQFTWERACHELAALTALERSLPDRGAMPEPQPFHGGAQRIAQSLSFTDRRFEWPAVFTISPSGESRPADTMSLGEISTELKLLAERLQQRSLSAGY